jgi:hypothetical protein
MELIIHKAELSVERAPAWLVPDAPVRVGIVSEWQVAVFARPPRRWFRPWAPPEVRLGLLSEDARDVILPKITTGHWLRVRIVELHPAYLAKDGQARIAISVWGRQSLSVAYPNALGSSS